MTLMRRLNQAVLNVLDEMCKKNVEPRRNTFFFFRGLLGSFSITAPVKHCSLWRIMRPARVSNKPVLFYRSQDVSAG